MAESFHDYPFWAPRFWHGMQLHHWWHLLTSNRCQVHPSRLGLAATVSLASIFNTKMSILQDVIYGHAIRQSPAVSDPVFILGHWRSGTTYLHELLSHDDRFVTPTTYQCFAPGHFVLTQSTIPKLLWFAMPSRRPMDNVEVGWNSPQEDEFALCAMGLPSPYTRMAFPNRPPQNLEYLNMEGLSEEAIERWSTALVFFLQAVMHGRQGRLVLKSPTHTGRIGLLSRLFPEARFIHLVRDPFVLFPSTLRLWQSLDRVQAFEVPRHQDLESYVLEAFDQMYRGFDRHAPGLSPDRLSHVRYEALVQDPLAELERLYDQLQLGDFASVRSRLTDVAAQKKDYRTNRYQITDAQRDMITRRWSDYVARYGYGA
jgi:hypothetical protein